MSLIAVESKLADRITGLEIKTDKFKTAVITVSFLVEATRESTVAASMLGKLLTRSTKRYPTPALFNNELNRLYGASVAASGTTVSDKLLFSVGIHFMNDRFSLTDEKISQKAAEMLCSVIFEPNVTNGKFLSEDFQIEKRMTAEEIDGLINDKRSYAITRTFEKMCKDEAFGIYPDKESLEKLTPASMYEFWKKTICTSPVKITVTGNSDCETVYKMINDGISEFRREPLDIKPSFSPVIPSKVRNFSEEMSIAQGKLVLGFRSNHSSLIGSVAADKVMTDIFGGGPYSKLFTVVREKMSLCYYCAARFYASKGILCVDSGIEIDNYENAKKGILDQLELMKKGEFDDAVITASKIGLANRIRSIDDSVMQVSNQYLLQSLNGNLKTCEQIIAEINSVTRESIIEAANNITLDTVYLLKGNGGDADE